MNIPTIARHFATVPQELADARVCVAVETSDDRDHADGLARLLKVAHKARSEAYATVWGPVRDHFAKIKVDLAIDAIETEARRLLGMVAGYDKRQQAARSAQLIAAAAATGAREVPAPVVVEPVKAKPVTKKLVLDAVDLAVLPIDMHTYNEPAIREAIRLGKAPVGVKYHWDNEPQWRAK